MSEILKVSVITICHNRVHSIQATIESVLSQDYSNIEYIVIDGGSTDGTVEKIEKYKNDLSVFVSEADNGMYSALNKGLKLATGDIVGILHSDDVYYESSTIRKVVEKFKRSAADLVYANGVYITCSSESFAPHSKSKKKTEDVTVNDYFISRIYKAKPFKKNYLNFGWIPLHTTIYVRREIFEKYGYYDECYSIASDYEISLRWFMNDAIRKEFMNEWVVKMSLGGKSTTASLQKKKSMEDFQIIQKYNLWGYFTLICKIMLKIPQYLLPQVLRIKDTARLERGFKKRIMIKKRRVNKMKINH